MVTRFSWQNPVGAASWNQPSMQRLLCVPRYFALVHVWGQGSEESKSPQETRQVLDKQSRAFEMCRTKVSEQTCSRTGERTHECASEFVSLAHACMGDKP